MDEKTRNYLYSNGLDPDEMTTDKDGEKSPYYNNDGTVSAAAYRNIYERFKELDAVVKKLNEENPNY